MRKIEAQLAEKGRAEGTKVPWGYAVAILKRQSGGVTKCFEHATVEQLRGVIAALTYDAKKKAGTPARGGRDERVGKPSGFGGVDRERGDGTALRSPRGRSILCAD